jgi:hypothetical protein
LEVTIVPGAPDGVDALEQRALDVELLDDGLEIQSAPAIFARSVSKPPVVISAAASAVKNGSGLSARARLRPSRAASAVTSSSSTGTPALAKCAAICAPIVPAPSTATDRIGMAACHQRAALR